MIGVGIGALGWIDFLSIFVNCRSSFEVSSMLFSANCTFGGT